MRIQRLRGRKTNEQLLRKGRMWRGRTMTIRYDLRPPRNAPALQQQNAVCYLGSFAPRSLDKSAVRRNRMRRRCREAMRMHVSECHTLPTIQLLIAPRSASLRSPSSDIQADVRDFIASLSHAR